MRLSVFVVVSAVLFALASASLSDVFQQKHDSLLKSRSSRSRPSHRHSQPQPQHVRAANAALPFLNVLDFGAAGDNSTDNTGPFQAAINAAQSGGGGSVIAPTGLYLFLGEISIPAGVTLQGSYSVVPSHDFVGGQALDDGTILLPTANRGNDSATPFITINENGAMHGVVIFYFQQETTALPVAYPWSVFMDGDNAAITDVELLNSWNGILAVQAHRHYIARIQGQPINIGLYVDETYDIGRLEDIHFNPWYSVNVPFIEWQTTYGRAFVLGRSDWEYVFNTFAFGYSIGYHFIETSTGSMNGNFLGIGADLAVNASVRVDASQPPGLLITNGEFTSFHSGQFDPTATSSPNQVYVSEGNTGPVHFVDSSFWGPTDAVANLYGTGTTIFSGCTFVQWDLVFHNDTAAINAYAGNLIVQGNEFQQAGVQINIGSGVSKATVVGNIFTGAQSIINNGKHVQIGLNAADAL